MDHTSKIELSKSALKNNLDYLSNLVGPDCVISHVVKGNAYGHGIKTYVPLAHELGAKHFSTFDAQEALQVLEVMDGKVQLMIMGMIENEQLQWAVENGVEFFVFENDRLSAAIETAKRAKKPAKIHVEFETGMNRTGYTKKELKEVRHLLKENLEHVEIKGFCTHYAGAESFANFLRVKGQYNCFIKRVEEMKKHGFEAERLHTACSAAMVRLPKTRMDMVRLGIMQYGFWPSTETYITSVQPKNPLEHKNPLDRVISWKSQVMSTKKVQQGEYIGYGTSFLASYDMIVASVPVGYGHGFSRSLSNQGRVLVRGKRVSVVGIVNMNLLMIDVSQVDNVEKGDEVVLIGNQGDLSISVSSFGDYSDQLNYELLTRLPHDIPRYIVN